MNKAAEPERVPLTTKLVADVVLDPTKSVPGPVVSVAAASIRRVFWTVNERAS